MKVGCVFAKVNDNYKLRINYKSEGLINYKAWSRMANGVVWRM